MPPSNHPRQRSLDRTGPSWVPQWLVTPRGLLLLLLGAGLLGVAVLLLSSGTDSAPVETAAEPEPTAGTATLGDTAKGRSLYVAPNGTKDGDGSKERPLDLATALSGNSPASPGDTLWLRGGTYDGNFVSELRGAEAYPIIVRQAPGERATIAAASANAPALIANGPYVWFCCFEILNNKPERQATQVQVPFQRGSGIEAGSPHLKFINLTIHDLQTGVVVPSSMEDVEVYGNIIYYNGWQRADGTGEGHGVVSPNETKGRIIRDNIIFGQFGHGIYAYGSHTDNLLIEGNTLFNNGGIAKFLDRCLLINETPSNLVLRANMTYYTGDATANVEGINIAYGSECSSTRVMDNYLTGGTPLNLTKCEPSVMTGNTLFGRFSPDYKVKYPKNDYFAPKDDPTLPTMSGVSVFVRPNQYEPGRASLTVYNWDRLPEVTANLSTSGLKNGDKYEIRNAQNFFGPAVASGTYDGQPVKISMLGLNAVAPIGEVTNQPPQTGRIFASLVLVNPASAPPAAPAPQTTSR